MIAIVIVPTKLKPYAEQAVRSLSPGSFGESFTVPLQAVDKPAEQPTHWLCSPIVSDAVASKIQGLLTTPPFAGACLLALCEPEEAANQLDKLCEQSGLEQIEVTRPGVETCPTCGRPL